MEPRRVGIGTALEATRFLASRIDIYRVIHDKLEISTADDNYHLFFSRSFLRAKGWSVIPLWEGKIVTLLREDRSELPFWRPLLKRSLETGGQFIYTAAIMEHRAQWQMDPAAWVFSFGCRKFDLTNEDPSEVFTVQPSKIVANLGGTNFLWPSNDRFLIYTDMDDATFIAGDRNELLDMLGVSYEYCVKRTKGVYDKWLKDWSVVNAWLNFCDEFSQTR